MSKTINTLFGPLSLPDSFFTYRKNISTLGNEEPEVSDDKYVFKFHLGGDVDLDCLKVSLKDNMLKVSYEKDSENGYTSYSSTRSLPDDANLETVKAESEGDQLTITVERKAKPEETKSRVIPITFED